MPNRRKAARGLHCMTDQSELANEFNKQLSMCIKNVTQRLHTKYYIFHSVN
jgi:hypothetical protein